MIISYQLFISLTIDHKSAQDDVKFAWTNDCQTIAWTFIYKWLDAAVKLKFFIFYSYMTICVKTAG